MPGKKVPLYDKVGEGRKKIGYAVVDFDPDLTYVDITATVTDPEWQKRLAGSVDHFSIAKHISEENQDAREP